MKKPAYFWNFAQNPLQSFYQAITFNYRYEASALKWWRPLNPTHMWLLFVEGFLQMRWFVRVYVCPFVSEAFEGDTVK